MFLFDIFPFLSKVLKAAPHCRSLRKQTRPGTKVLRYHRQEFLCFVFCQVILSNLVSAEVMFAPDFPDEAEGFHPR